MRRQQFTLTDRLILRISGCLLLVLLPIVVVLACALVVQGFDLMAGESDATSARRLSRMAATPSTNHLAAEPAWPTPHAIPIAHVAGRATAAPLPVRSPRYQSTPTPGFISRLFAAAVNMFSETAPTPTRTLAVIPEATPTLPPPPPPTNTPTLMPSPTPAATPSSQPSPTPLPTATPTPLVAQVSSASTVNVRAGPGTYYPVVGTLQPNNLLPVTGRNQDSTWWQVQQANGQTGWVAAWVVEASDVAGVAVASTPPPPQSPPTSVPPPTNTSSPTPTSIPEYDFVLAEFFNSPTTNAFLVIYVAIVDTKGIPIGDMKIVGTRLDHNLTYESPLSTWHFEGYNAPGQVIKSGNVKFEAPGGIETTSWVLHLEDTQGNRQSDDIPFDVDENDKQWYFIKLGRKY